MSRRAALMFGLLCIVWGIPYLLIKVAVEELSPVTLVFARTALGGLVLLPLAVRRGALAPVLSRWRPLLAYTVVEIAASWVLLSWAETRLPSSLTGLLVAAVPLTAVGVGFLTGRREPLGARGLTGLLLGVAGVAALVGLDVHGAQTLAVAAVAAVVVCYATGPVIMARSLGDLPGIGVVTASLLVCAAGYLPFALLSLPPAWPSARVVTSVVLLAVLCTALAFLLLFALVAELGPVRPTVVTYVNPAVAVLAGVVVLHESLTAATLVGFALVLAGSVLATRRHAPAAAPASPVPARCLEGETPA